MHSSDIILNCALFQSLDPVPLHFPRDEGTVDHEPMDERMYLTESHSVSNVESPTSLSISFAQPLNFCRLN